MKTQFFWLGLPLILILPISGLAQRPQLVQNGDFSQGVQGWTTSIGTGCAGLRTATVIPSDPPFAEVLDVSSVGAGGCGGNTTVYQNLSISVAQYNSLILTANVKAISATVASGCGSQGQEYPINIRVDYVDPNSVQKALIFAFYFGGGTCGNPTGVPSGITFVTTAVPQNSWFTFSSGNLKDWIEDGSTITRIEVLGGGWDYDGRADNLRLRPGNVNTGIPSAEPALAVAANDINRLVVAANGFDTENQTKGAIPYSVSNSTGSEGSWIGYILAYDSSIPPGILLDAVSDPFLASTSSGDVYLGYLLMDSNCVSHKDGWSSIHLQRISANHIAVDGPIFTATDHDNDTNPLPCEDKPSLHIDTPSARGKDNIYVTWTRVGNVFQGGGIYFSYSNASSPEIWSTPTKISDGFKTQGSNVKSGPNGEVYVTWFDEGFFSPASIRFKRIDPGVAPPPNSDVCVSREQSGGSCDANATVDPITILNGNTRPHSFPWMDVDRSFAQYGGQIYVVWAAKNNKPDADIFMSVSRDGGINWSAKLRVNSDDLSAGDQFYPIVAVDQSNGDIYVAYYDRRDDPGNILTHVYINRSTDGGASFGPSIRVTDQPSDPNCGDPNEIDQNPLGDYLGLSAQQGLVFVAWTDTRNAVQPCSDPNNRRQDIFTASLDFTGTLSVAVTSPNGGAVAGATVSVSGGPLQMTSNTGTTSFSFAPGIYTTQVSATGFQTATFTATVLTGQNTPVNLTLVPVGAGFSTTVQVPATADQNFDSGVSVNANDTLIITAAGIWGYGPVAPGYPLGPDGIRGCTGGAGWTLGSAPSCGALAARIGSGNWFYVGSSLTTNVTSSGHVFLSINDLNGVFWDNVGQMDVTLKVVTPLTVAVTYPNGAEKLFTGTSSTITWTAPDNSAPSFFDVFYSTNGGTSYPNPVPGCTGISGAARSCVWATPGPATTTGRIKVTGHDASGNTASDSSDANYSVVSGTGSITVTQPNTALTWIIGATQQIKWNHNLGSNSYVAIELSRDGGTNWETISASFKNTGATASTFSWVVTGLATTQARVRVTWLNGPVSDISNVNFTIANPSVTVTQPNTALNWGIGSTQQIKWNHNVGLAAAFTIEVSRDGGLTYPVLITTTAPATTATTGVYNWTVTGPATTQARARVTWNTNPVGTDISNLNFTIANAFVSVALPSSAATNWGYGSLQTQNWATNLGPGDRVNLLMSTDGGVTFPITLASNVVASLKTLKVTTPTLGAPTTLARVRVEWVANPTVAGMNPVNFKVQPPFVTVTKPNGPTHLWTIGTIQTITWTHNLGSLENVKIELSVDGGATYSVVLFTSTPSDGAQPVVVQAGWASQQGRVRITWLKDGTVTDASDQNFPIQ